MIEGAPGLPAIAKLSDWGHALFLGAEPTRVTNPDWYSPRMRFLTASFLQIPPYDSLTNAGHTGMSLTAAQLWHEVIANDAKFCTGPG